MLRQANEERRNVASNGLLVIPEKDLKYSIVIFKAIMQSKYL